MESARGGIIRKQMTGKTKLSRSYAKGVKKSIFYYVQKDQIHFTENEIELLEEEDETKQRGDQVEQNSC